MQIVQDRRALHQIPELGYDLPKTVAYVTAALQGLNCQVFSPIAGSVCAYFDFGKPDTLAFRADMDALPVPEKNQVDYASRHPGCMHACGHDGHTAILLELARRIHKKSSLPHNILLVFQPAEESTGGAKPICDTGVFARYGVKTIFGLHLWSGLPLGQIASRKGPLMSLSAELSVDIFGRSSHISKPKEGLDALLAANLFYTKARALEASLPADILRLLNFGKMVSGDVRNVISNHSRLEGGLRTFSQEVFDHLFQGLQEIAAQVEKETGCTVKMELSNAYPAVTNPEDLYDKVAALVPVTPIPQPNMGAEDFAWYQKFVPGMFFFLGIGDTPPLHADTFDFDEQALTYGANLFEKLAEEFV